MKKIIIILLFIFTSISCGRHIKESHPVYDFTLIRQVRIANPTFTISMEKDENNYYFDQIEDAFIKQGITLYSAESRVIETESEGKAGGLVVTSDGMLGIGAGKSNSKDTTTIKNLNKTSATFIYMINCYTWTYRVLLVDTHELVMKGRINYNFDQEIPMMIRVLTGVSK